MAGATCNPPISQNFYGDYGSRRDGVEIHLDLTLANSVINGPGTSPVELLAADPAAQFTAPNAIGNRYAPGWPAGEHRPERHDVCRCRPRPITAISSSAWSTAIPPTMRRATMAAGCCARRRACPARRRGGAPIRRFSEWRGPYSELDDQTTNTNAYGAAAAGDRYRHAVRPQQPFCRRRCSFDGAQTEFSAHRP